MAIIYAVRHFRTYLLGTKFKIITDCNSVTMTLEKKSINGRIARWALELQDYDYEMHYRAGKNLPHVDALSRCHQVCVIGTADVEDRSVIAQSRDAHVKDLYKRLEDGCAGFRTPQRVKKLLFVPAEMEDNVIRISHELVGHQSVEKTMARVMRNYWMPGILKKVEKFCRNCLPCLMHSEPTGKLQRNLHMIPKPAVPFDTIHVDHFGPCPAVSSNRKHILVIVDAFTKCIRLFAVKSTSTKEVICCQEKYFKCYSRPRRIIPDRGTCFTSF